MGDRDNGDCPDNYLEMIDRLMGSEYCFILDINPKTNPDLVDGGQVSS